MDRLTPGTRPHESEQNALLDELQHLAFRYFIDNAQVWIDCRDIQDDPMRAHGMDYFENSRRAAYVHQQHAIQNPSRFNGYGEHAWGITASEGPIVLMIENYRSGLIWRLMRQCPYVVDGLRRAGFSGGWLNCDTEAW